MKNDNIVDASTLTQTCDQKKTDEKKIFIRKWRETLYIGNFSHVDVFY